MAARVFSISCTQLLCKYQNSKIFMEARCLSSLVGTIRSVRPSKVPQIVTAVRHPRPVQEKSTLAYREGRHVDRPYARGHVRWPSLHTSSADFNGGTGVANGPEGSDEGGGGMEDLGEERKGVSGSGPEESNLQAYAQEVSGCEECHPEMIARDQELEGLMRNIEIAKMAQTLPDSIPVKRKPSRLDIRRFSPMTIEELVAFLHEERAVDLCVIELPPEMEYVNYFVTCSGMGTRHIRRIADNLTAELKAVKFGGRAVVEGRESEGWIAVDMGTVVVHLMSEEVREKYELEKLWTLGRNYDDQYQEMEAYLEQSDSS